MGFQVTVRPSARVFEANADETILGAAIRQGIGLPYGCKDGACGSCKCKKLSGEVVHREHQSKALSEQEAALGYILTCCAIPHTDVELESRQVTDESAFPVRKMPVRVISVQKAGADVAIVRLQLPANDKFRYHAGQYIEFILRDGSRRAYSMANAPHTQEQEAAIELHIRHMPSGKFTDHVFLHMKEKEILRSEGPLGSFYLRQDSQKPIVMVASGTGFAPIKAILQDMQHRQINRPVTLYWGGRRPQDLYQNDWVQAQLELMPQLRYVPVISDALPEDQWPGRTGFVHQAVLDDFEDLSAYQVYACGAPIVVNSARQSYIQHRRLPEEEFYADSFTSEADKHGESVAP